jgi:hypothetical protein
MAAAKRTAEISAQAVRTVAGVGRVAFDNYQSFLGLGAPGDVAPRVPMVNEEIYGSSYPSSRPMSLLR